MYVCVIYNIYVYVCVCQCAMLCMFVCVTKSQALLYITVEPFYKGHIGTS